MTKIFGVIGDPIEHSLSPVLHNAAYRELGLDAAYRKFHVKDFELAAFLERVRSGEIQGVNVTVPHKTLVSPLVDVVRPEAQRTRAINTVWNQDGQLIADNADGRGYLKSLFQNFELTVESQIVILGAGGAALAITDALADLSPEAIHVVNRNIGRAENLVVRTQASHPNVFLRACGWEDLDYVAQYADLIINTTILGMSGQADWPSLDFVSVLPVNCIVSDIVYRPLMTPFLKAAEARGLNVLTGDGMLLHQAALSFEWMTGQKAPVNVMRAALNKELT